MSNKKCQFKEGQLVVLKTGYAPQIVLGVRPIWGGSWEIRCTYHRWFQGCEELHTKWRRQEDFDQFNGDPDQVAYPRTSKYEKATSVNKLYQTLEENPRFGTYLATNSTGQIVLELKGTNQVEAFDKDKIEEVKPYTIACLNHEGRQLNFTTTKDRVKEGDLVIGEFGLVRVAKINTGFEGNAPELVGRKVMTEEL